MNEDDDYPEFREDVVFEPFTRVSATTTEISGLSLAIFQYISAYTDKHGYGPTVREVGEAVGISSSATTHKYLERLRDKGRVTWQQQAARTLRAVSQSGTDSFQKSTKTGIQ